MKIYSFNVNGIRSATEKGFLDWLKKEKPEIVCLQEIKANSDQLEDKIKKVNGYYTYFNSAKRKGYAGTAVYTRIKPEKVDFSIKYERFDNEGRSIILTFNEFVLYNFYIPNGARDKRDIPYKIDVYKKLLKIFNDVKDKNVILVGDFNVAHNEMDVYNAKQNIQNTMFTPEERKQLDAIINSGYIDTFREKNPEKQSYSWWPYMANLRERDIGWRIDYVFVSKKLYPKIQDAFIRKDILGSDHCPVGIEMQSKMNMDNPIYPKNSLF